jgi:SNF2 family DNA or RNA helicase
MGRRNRFILKEMPTRKDLHNYQNRSVDFIVGNTHVGLFAEMGTGKTISTLTAIDVLTNEEFEINKTLIVAPKRVAEVVWSDEVEKWSHLKNLKVSKISGDVKQRRAALKAEANVYTISRDNIAWLIGEYNSGYLPFDMLVIDESSSFKNHESVRFKALKAVQALFKRIVILTGTPVPNGLIDLWAQVWLLDRGERLGKTISMYRSNYFSLRRGGHGYEEVPGADERIHNRIKDICMSLKSEDYLELPERIDKIIKVVLPREVKKKYDDFEREKVLELAALDAEDITVLNAASLSNKLLQFAGGAVYDSDKQVHIMHNCKLEACEEFIEEANGKPVFIAYSYKHELDRLLKHLSKYKPVKLEKDQDIKDWNAGKIRVMLAHPASVSHGLNLQEGHTMSLWFTLSWSLELYQQFNKRLHRQGRKYPVVIGHLIAEGTEDVTVMRALDRKSTTQEALMDAVKAKFAKYIKNFNF